MRDALRSPLLRRLAVCEALLGVQFWFPVWFFFLRDRGFSLAVIVLADTLYRVVIVLAEAPLGMLADHWGRKRSYVALCVLTVVTFVLAVNVRSTLGLLVVWSLWGVQWAAVSGVGSAYLVALLRQRVDGVRDAAAFGALRAVTSAVGALTLALSGPMYAVDPRLPFAACGLCALVALALAVGLPSTEREDRPRPSTPGGPGWWRTSRPTPEEARLVALGSLVLAAAWTTILLWQPLVLEQGWAALGAGFMYTAWSVAGMVAGILVARARDLRGTRPVLVGYVVVVLGLLGTGLAPALGPVLFVPLIGVGYWTASTLLEARIATTARSKRRATMLSLVSMVGGVGIAVLRPVLSAVYAEWGLQVAFVLFGLLAAAMLVPLTVLLRRLASPTEVAPVG